MTSALGQLLELAGPVRNQQVNRRLAYHLAWVAGVLNSVGFVAVGFYTSHMTGITASIADQLVLGGWTLVGLGVVAVAFFLMGAMACALQFNWARRRPRWHDRRFALVLLSEAMLVLLIGGLADVVVSGAREWLLVAALGFVMGQQNALITKVSDATIRTTHVTGMVTDIGIELGKGLYRNRLVDADPVRADLGKLSMLSLLVVQFFLGGVMGALGYLWLGFTVLLVPAVLLLVMAVPPLLRRPGR
ncbi:YoaK family protein [Ornithinimicrobium panacihumi]|uniref:YoaK family protein n=1 Tax=Ornithinimicrobium panacihumi TaxID=2008449 RepID=UPI003F8CCA3A